MVSRGFANSMSGDLAKLSSAAVVNLKTGDQIWLTLYRALLSTPIIMRILLEMSLALLDSV